MPQEPLAGRCYARVYRQAGKQRIHEFLTSALALAGGRVLYASGHTRAPVYFGVEVSEDERLGILCYPFRATNLRIRNRPTDEYRAQIRYGAEQTWNDDHYLGLDVAGIDVTVVLAVHLEAEILIGLDPLVYNPLPMGISFEFKDEDVDQVHAHGWHAWERPNRPGRRRAQRRAEDGLETVIGFRPERFLDYVRLERQALSLGLDPLLRLKAATRAATESDLTKARHVLEEQFHLDSQEVLEIISRRMRLRVAVKGGVAEHHLLRAIRRHPEVRDVIQVDQDGPPDLQVLMRTGARVNVECKNGMENAYANGDGRVEVQKTRASRNDPASRLYKTDQFDVIAVCLWPASGAGPPVFRFRASAHLESDTNYPDRIKAMQRIDATWSDDLAAALKAELAQ